MKAVFFVALAFPSFGCTFSDAHELGDQIKIGSCTYKWAIIRIPKFATSDEGWAVDNCTIADDVDTGVDQDSGLAVEHSHTK